MTHDTTLLDAAERAAHHANGDVAKAENLKILAEIAVTADARQQADHIRAIVAVTMAQIAADAKTSTKDGAAQWQAWALGLSDALVPDGPTAAQV